MLTQFAEQIEIGPGFRRRCVCERKRGTNRKSPRSVFPGGSDRLEQEPPGFVLLPGVSEPLGLEAEEFGLEEAGRHRVGQRPSLVEQASSGFTSTLAHVGLGEESPDHDSPDVAGPEFIRKRPLEFCDPLLVLPHARERPAAHRVSDAEELRVDDLVLERQRPFRFEERGVRVAVDLKRVGCVNSSVTLRRRTRG